jgi:predicted signal transduction protein with EAL and GGDEF domain
MKRRPIHSDSSWLEALPETIALIRRDGVVLGGAGGRGTGLPVLAGDSVNAHVRTLWPGELAELAMRMLRRSLSSRTTIECECEIQGARLELRVTPQGPDKAICSVRAALQGIGSDGDAGSPSQSTGVERRGFVRRFKDAVANASLGGRPLALAVIHVDGLRSISSVMDTGIGDQVCSLALQRVSSRLADYTDTANWFMGQIGEDELAAVVCAAGRERVEVFVAAVCSALAEPIAIGNAAFELKPSAGVAILGQDANAPQALLDHARAAEVEARRSQNAPVFYSDTLKLRALSRLDTAEELRQAIAERQVRLRYKHRHDLVSGRMTAWVGYLAWHHPLRGEVRPAEFLGIAEATGLGVDLSRSVLDTLRRDCEALLRDTPASVRISFGALRHHVVNQRFVDEIRELVRSGLPAERLELRISERAYISRDAGAWKEWADLGIQLVVDEFGRLVSSLESLARAPLHGLQLDHGWAARLGRDASADKVCRAVIAMARALDIVPIATGVDDESRRAALVQAGYAQGSGDLYIMSTGSAESRQVI